MAIRVTDFSDADKGSAQTTQVQTCFPEQLLGSFVACQSQMQA